MSPELIEQLIVAAVILIVFTAFLKEWVSPDLVAMGGLVALLCTGILGSKDISYVFGNPAPIIIAAMFILSAALENTGVIEALGNWFEKAAGKKMWQVILVMGLVVAPLSAFVNNTPVVVVFMPIILSLCRKHNLKASKLLIPLSYIAITGGTCTIIGTSTNVVASATSGLEPFGMFEVTKLGIIFVAITLLYLLFIGGHLLPERITLSTLFEAEEGREFITHAVVSDDSPMIGKLFPETRLAKVREIRVIEVIRNRQSIQRPLNEIEIAAGDLILFKSRAAGVLDVAESAGVEIPGRQELGLQGVHTESAVLMEGIVGPHSSLVGQTLSSLNFRQRFGVLILALHRRGVNLKENFQNTPLAFGDTLLVEGPAEGMKSLFNEKDFINLSKPGDKLLRRSKAPLAILALLAFVLLGAFKVMSTEAIALSVTFFVLLTRCIEPRDAYRAVEWKVVFMIIGMLGVGRAVQVTGLAEVMAGSIESAFGSWGDRAILAAVYLLAALLTELISNTAVAALLTPVAVGIAVNLGYDPRPFVVAVMFGASASFSTPVGYQTNTYVYGAGGYKFSDFCRAGIPLALILWVVASLLIPIFWEL